MATKGRGTDASGGGPKARANWLRRARWAAGLAVVVLVLIVLFQNVETATFEVLLWTPELPRFVVPLLAFVAGAVAGVVAWHLLRRRRG